MGRPDNLDDASIYTYSVDKDNDSLINILQSAATYLKDWYTGSENERKALVDMFENSYKRRLITKDEFLEFLSVNPGISTYSVNDIEFKEGVQSLPKDKVAPFVKERQEAVRYAFPDGVTIV
jgi:hypothetical protein